METAFIYPIENLEIRRRGGGGGRSMRGSFGFSRGVGRGLVTLKNRGRRRKERMSRKSFSWSVKEIKRLRDDLERTLKQHYKSEATAEVEALKQEVARRDVHILYGHDWNRPLGSVAGGTVALELFDDDEEENPRLEFEVELPEENKMPSYMLDTVRQVENGLIGGVSPGFVVAPKPNAETIEVEEKTGVEIRVVNEAVLYELSLVTRPSYTDSSVEVKAEDFEATHKRIKLWL